MSMSIRSFLPLVEVYKDLIQKKLLENHLDMDMLGIAMIEFLDEHNFTPEDWLEKVMIHMQVDRKAHMIEKMRHIVQVHDQRRALDE